MKKEGTWPVRTPLRRCGSTPLPPIEGYGAYNYYPGGLSGPVSVAWVRVCSAARRVSCSDVCTQGLDGRNSRTRSDGESGARKGPSRLLMMQFVLAAPSSGSVNLAGSGASTVCVQRRGSGPGHSGSRTASATARDTEQRIGTSGLPALRTRIALNKPGFLLHNDRAS